MAITLSNGTTTLTLPEDLIWTDEFAWRPVVAKYSNSVAGALLITRGVKLTGRPMTLSGGDDWAWMRRDLVETLFDWSTQAGLELTLTFRGQTFDVAFDHSHDERPIEAEPRADWPEYEADDKYSVVLRLIQKD